MTGFMTGCAFAPRHRPRARATGLVTPPVGILLCICANFAGVKLEEESRKLGPFLGAGVTVLIIISLFPATVLWLPRLLVGYGQ
jgi:TRAP-type transport system large permease protein